MKEQQSRFIHSTYCLLSVCVAVLVGCSVYLGGGLSHFSLDPWAQGLLFAGLSLSGFLLMAWGLTQERNRLISLGLTTAYENQNRMDTSFQRPWFPSMCPVAEEETMSPTPSMTSLSRSDSDDSLFSNTSD